LDYGGGPVDGLVFARGRFGRQSPTEIRVWWLKRSPSEGRFSRGGGLESGEGELPPSHSRLHPPLHHHLLRIQDQRECPLPVPSPPPGWHSRPVSFAFVLTAIHYGYSWPPALPHPQVKVTPRGHWLCARDPAQERTSIVKQKLVQVDEIEFERVHPGDVNPFPERDWAGAKIHISPMSKKPPDPGVDLCITQLYGEGMIGTTWPRILSHNHFSLAEWLNASTNKGPQEVCAQQPSS
jgi:hypothetical protein